MELGLDASTPPQEQNVALVKPAGMGYPSPSSTEAEAQAWRDYAVLDGV